MSRNDESGRAYAGSQRQIQTYVNSRREELSAAAIDAMKVPASLNPRLNWVSPLAKDKYSEYQDTAFLKAVGLDVLAGELRAFWPRGGPVWDALAAVELDNGQRGVVLVEAKSHVSEIYGSGMQAKASRSREKILNALSRTKAWLGVAEDTDWTGPLYQSANRRENERDVHKIISF